MRTIDIRARYEALGCEKTKGLLGLHAYSGAYWRGKFAGISKSRSMGMDIYLKLDSSSEMLDIFKKLGKDEITTSILEHFAYAQSMPRPAH